MTRNPFANALAAAGYIVLIVLVVSTIVEGTEGPDTILIPMTMLSLFVLSAAVMGYIFLAQPIMLYLEGHKKEAVDFFLKTVGMFACMTVAFLLALVVVGSQM